MESALGSLAFHGGLRLSKGRMVLGSWVHAWEILGVTLLIGHNSVFTRQRRTSSYQHSDILEYHYHHHLHYYTFTSPQPPPSFNPSHRSLKANSHITNDSYKTSTATTFPLNSQFPNDPLFFPELVSPASRPALSRGYFACAQSLVYLLRHRQSRRLGRRRWRRLRWP